MHLAVLVGPERSRQCGVYQAREVAKCQTTRLISVFLCGGSSRLAVFAKGNTIFREGEQADEFFVVVHGEVEIRSGNRWFETVGPNGIFGEMAIIDDSTRSATVVALTDVTVVPIQEQQFLHGQAHAVLRTKGDARPRQPAAPAEQGGLKPGLPVEFSGKGGRPPARSPGRGLSLSSSANACEHDLRPDPIPDADLESPG